SDIVDIADAGQRRGNAKGIRKHDNPGADFGIETDECAVTSRAAVVPNYVTAITRKDAVERNGVPPDHDFPPGRTTYLQHGGHRRAHWRCNVAKIGGEKR